MKTTKIITTTKLTTIMKKIKKLPKNAKFDYKDNFGTRHYQTRNRRYETYATDYGRKIKVYSFKKDE